MGKRTAPDLSERQRRRLALEMKELYEDHDYSVRNLQHKYGYSYGYVHILLTEVGTRMRGRGHHKKGY